MPGVQGSVGGESFRLQGGRPCFSRLRGLSKNTGQRENVALTAAIKSIPFPKNTKRVSKAPSQNSKAGLNTCLLLIEKFCLSSYKEFLSLFRSTLTTLTTLIFTLTMSLMLTLRRSNLDLRRKNAQIVQFIFANSFEPVLFLGVLHKFWAS